MPVTRVWRVSRRVELNPLMAFDRISPQIVAVTGSIQPAEHENLLAHRVVGDWRVYSGAGNSTCGSRSRPLGNGWLVVRPRRKHNQRKKEHPWGRTLPD